MWVRLILIFSLVVLAPRVSANSWFSGWCARNLVSDDPYQWEYLREYPTDILVRIFWMNQTQVAWNKEVRNPAFFDAVKDELRRRGEL